MPVDKNASQKNLDQSLYSAITFHDIGRVKALLDQGADPNALDILGEQTIPFIATHIAYVKKNTDILTLLLKRGGDPNKPCRDNGKTPLGYAASLYELNLLNVLLDNGSDPNVPTDIFGNTALYIALSTYSLNPNIVDIISALIKHGADPLQKNNDGQTPYQYMKKYPFNKKIILMIEKAKTQVNYIRMQEPEYPTPDSQFIAAIKKNTYAVMTALANGANPEAVDHNGQSALVLAKLDNISSIVNLLQKPDTTLHVEVEEKPTLSELKKILPAEPVVQSLPKTDTPLSGDTPTCQEVFQQAIRDLDAALNNAQRQQQNNPPAYLTTGKELLQLFKKAKPKNDIELQLFTDILKSTESGITSPAQFDGDTYFNLSQQLLNCSTPHKQLGWCMIAILGALTMILGCVSILCIGTITPISLGVVISGAAIQICGHVEFNSLNQQSKRYDAAQFFRSAMYKHNKNSEDDAEPLTAASSSYSFSRA